jgi:hypothetical protein
MHAPNLALLRTSVAVATFCMLVLLAPELLADKITRNNGSTLEGKIIEETDAAVTIKMPNGTVTVKREDIKSIEKGESPGERIERQLESLHPSKPNEYFDLGEWCISQKGFGPQGVLLLKLAGMFDTSLYVKSSCRIGEYYLSARDKNRAILHYSNALAAEPTNADVQKKMVELRGTGKMDVQEANKSLAEGLKAFLESNFKDAVEKVRKASSSPIARRVKNLIGCTIDEFVKFCESAIPCSTCKGTGQVNCLLCRGKGTTECTNCNSTGNVSTVGAGTGGGTGSGKVKCRMCKGFGNYLCERCKAEREVTVTVMGSDGSQQVYAKKMGVNREFDPADDPDIKAFIGSGQHTILVSIKGGKAKCPSCFGKAAGDSGIVLDATKIANLQYLLEQGAVSLMFEEMLSGKMRMTGRMQHDPDLCASRAFVWHAGKWMTVAAKRGLVKSVAAYDWPPRKRIDVSEDDIRKKARPLQASEGGSKELMKMLAQARSAPQEAPASAADIAKLAVYCTTFSPRKAGDQESLCFFEPSGDGRVLMLKFLLKQTEGANYLTCLAINAYADGIQLPAEASLPPGDCIVAAYYAVTGSSTDAQTEGGKTVMTDRVQACVLLVEFREKGSNKVIFSFRP